MKDSERTEVHCEGPVDGMGSKDPDGSYVKIVQQTKSGVSYALISGGAAEELRDQIDAALAQIRLATDEAWQKEG
jgi:hypothetical protein